MTKPKSTPSTPLASPARRAGTYDREDEVTWLLRYGTHTFVEVPRDLRTMTGGSAADRDLVLHGDGISGHHFVMVRRARGLYVTDDASTNGLAYEGRRYFRLALKAGFEDKRDTGEGFRLSPGMTFLVGTDANRFIALDDVMRAEHAKLVEILGAEDEVPTATVGGETPAPSDLILAADSPGHLLITGKPGCEAEELARIVHKISKRRGQPFVPISGVPPDRKGQSALLTDRAARGTLVLQLGTDRKRLDPSFVASMLSPSFNVRAIVIARTPNQARRALGHQNWRQLMHVALCPMDMRRTAIPRLLDHLLAERGSVLRMADLTADNRRALLFNAWRENLQAVREAAVRLDALVLAQFSRRGAATLLGLKRQSYAHWFNNTMRLAKPLVPEARERALLAALAKRNTPAT